MKDLETRLDVRLFERRRGMKITPEGEVLLRSARAILDEVERVEHDLQRLRSGYQGTIRIATECYTCYSWLPGVLERFREDFPKVDVVLVPSAKQTPLEFLRNGVLDLAIVQRHYSREAGDIAFTRLFSDELVAVLPARHPLASRSHLKPEDFRDEVLILHSSKEDSTVVREFLLPAGVDPGRVLELQLTEAVLECVRAGLGITVLARWALASFAGADDLPTRPLSPRGMRRVWHADRLASRPAGAALQSLVRILRKAIPGSVTGRPRRGSTRRERP
jgi:LysR family transcriptional regulator for metE and metH